MGTFNIRCKIENPAERSRWATLSHMLVDTGSECTWIPAATLEKLGIQREKNQIFLMANGEEITRGVGFAIIRYEKHFTIDEVVFAEKGDLLLFGARTLEGMNLRVDSVQEKLVAAGPVLAASPKRIR